MHAPGINKLNSKNFVTYRRFWLDSILDSFAPEMRGIVLDIGGKRENKRGSFQPPEQQARGWWYINIDWDTKPNIFANVSTLPILSNRIDTIICTEVLEHLEHPEYCITELHRCLHKDGVALVSVPFLYPIHADPYDFQRFTDAGLRLLFSKFSHVDIVPMGGYLGTIGMLIEIGLTGVTGQRLDKKIIRRSLTWLSRQLYMRDLSKPDQENASWQKFTTGYFVRAIK